jgi:hypothetical protein
VIVRRDGRASVAAISPPFRINIDFAGKSARVRAFSLGDKRDLCRHNGGDRGDTSWLGLRASFCF